MVEFLIGYKIYDKVTGLYSKGVIQDNSWQDNRHYVNFGKDGKTWTKEKLLKAHLLKCAQHKILSENWEVIEVTYRPTKPMSEWIDSKMLTKILKY